MVRVAGWTPTEQPLWLTLTLVVWLILIFVIICPIAIAFSMGQIIRTNYKLGLRLSVCQCVYLSVCEHSHGRISWSIFTKIGTEVKNPQKVRTSSLGVNIAPPLPLVCPQNPLFRPRGNPICLKCTRIAEIFASLRKSGRRNTMVTSNFRREVEIWLFRACAMHPAIII